MKTKMRRLQIQQLSRTLDSFTTVSEVGTPDQGWIHSIRTTIGMSLRQLGERINKTPQGVRKLEQNESKGSISLKNMKELGKALDMRFVYGFAPKHGSLEKMIEDRAKAIAKELVSRTHNTMVLEAQQVKQNQLKQEIQELTDELIRELPRHLWD